MEVVDANALPPLDNYDLAFDIHRI